MNRKALSLVMAGLLSASAVIPAFASGTGTSGGATPTPNGTEVWAGITLYDADARVKVEVPTLFAFVVNGTVSAADTGVISAADGSLLLPNVKVKVDTASSTGIDGEYSIQTVGDGVMQFTNYSTKAVENAPQGDSGRTGLAVTVNGNIKNEGDAESRNYWEHVSELVGDDESGNPIGLATEFKKYNISIGGNSLSTAADGGLQLAAEDVIELDAPLNIDNSINLNTTTGLANSGRTKTVPFDVAVGGQRGQYNQVEQSAKVGTIVWTISANVENPGGVNTAPDNDYLPDETVAP